MLPEQVDRPAKQDSTRDEGYCLATAKILETRIFYDRGEGICFLYRVQRIGRMAKPLADAKDSVKGGNAWEPFRPVRGAVVWQ